MQQESLSPLKNIFLDEIITVNIVIVGQKEKLAAIEEFSPKKSQSSKGNAIDPIIKGIISKLENIPSNTSLFKAIKISLET